MQPKKLNAPNDTNDHQISGIKPGNILIVHIVHAKPTKLINNRINPINIYMFFNLNLPCRIKNKCAYLYPSRLIFILPPRGYKLDSEVVLIWLTKFVFINKKCPKP